jgi:hypothetical protein
MGGEESGGGGTPPDTGTPLSDPDASAMDDSSTPVLDASTSVPEGSTSGSCSLQVTMKTLTDNGGYSPRNVGAIWIATSSGGFVKTLAVWARARLSRLALWNSSTSMAGLSRNTVDAITGATLSSHQTHMVTWTCTDTKEAVVPDGTYRLYFEMDDQNSPGPNGYVTFTKGKTAQTIHPPDQTYFQNISLAFVP